MPDVCDLCGRPATGRLIAPDGLTVWYGCCLSHAVTVAEAETDTAIVAVGIEADSLLAVLIADAQTSALN